MCEQSSCAPIRRYALLLDQKCLRRQCADGTTDWVAPSDALFPGEAMDRELRSTLLYLHLPLVEPPDEVVALLQHACTSSTGDSSPAALSKANPAAVRHHLLTQLLPSWENDLTDAQCHQLLQYCLSDLSSEALSPVSVATVADKAMAQGICAEVKRLPLFPLHDGSRTSIEAATSCLVLCAADEWEHLRPAPALVVAIEPASTLGGQLAELIDVFDGKLSLLPTLPLELLPRLLLPPAWHGTRVQPLADTDCVEDGRSAKELGRVLAFISRHHAQETIPGSFGEWPIVPATDGAAHTLVSSARQPPMLCMWNNTCDALINCLGRLGCKQLHPAVRDCQSSEPLHTSLTMRAPMLTAQSALNALHEGSTLWSHGEGTKLVNATLDDTDSDQSGEGECAGSGGAQIPPHQHVFCQRLADAAPAERHALREYLATSSSSIKGAPLPAHALRAHMRRARTCGKHLP